MSGQVRPNVQIVYCSRCRFLLRATWTCQELLSTFVDEITVTLVPGDGGVFEVWFDGECWFSKQRDGRYPEPKEIKQKIRDRIDPDRSLGHSDKKG